MRAGGGAGTPEGRPEQPLQAEPGSELAFVSFTAQPRRQMGNGFHLCCTKQAQLRMSGACERKQKYHFSPQVCFKESVLCKCTKYGNLSDNQGILAALFSNSYTFSLKKICSISFLFFTIQWLGSLKLHYMSLIVTQMGTRL